MKVTEAHLEVLGSASPDGRYLYLTCGQLDTKLYRQVADLLETRGGVWTTSAQGFVFPEGVSAWDAVVDITSREDVLTAAERKKDTQFFPTPADVVEELLEAGRVARSHVILEPSAGTGAIAAMAAGRAAAVDCVEMDTDYAAAIQSAGYARRLTVGDFLALPAVAEYDRVLMNPPFTRGADAAHVLHALGFVKPGGRLVAVLPDGIQHRRDKRSRAVQEAVTQAHGFWEALPDGAFEESGTKIRTTIVVIPVPEPDRDDPDTPLRVTMCPDATGYRWFDPMTAAPGAYIHDHLGGRDRVFRFEGWCVGCGRRTWGHDDCNDDVRGSFGANTSVPVTDEDLTSRVPGPVPPDTRIPRCGACWGDTDRDGFERALHLAARQYTTPPVLTVVEPEQVTLLPAVPRVPRVKPAKRALPAVPAAAGERAATVGRAVDMMEQLGLFDVA